MVDREVDSRRADEGLGVPLVGKLELNLDILLPVVTIASG